MKNEKFKISIIVVHWNTPKELKTQMSLLHQGYAGQAKLKTARKDIEIIVVDNASKQTKEFSECFATLKQNNVALIKNKENKGFAKANNQGARIAKGEWLLFLNPDVLFTTDSILKFVATAEKLHLDACSPEPESKNYKKPLPSWSSLLIEFTPLRRNIPLEAGSKIYTLTGGCLLIRKDIFKTLGGWDERFFLWFEDSDLTKRLVENNYSIGWIQIAHTHRGGVSFRQLAEREKKKLFFASMKTYADKHFNRFGKLIVNFISFWNLHVPRSTIHAL